MIKKISAILLIVILISSLFFRNTFFRLYDGFRSAQISKEREKYYVIKDGSQITDITEILISDKTIPADLKQPLISGERRIVIFKYPSDSQIVAGYLSYLTKGTHPVMIFLRGGNGYYGIMRPNNRFSFLKGYNVVGTLYRGNIYGGQDEFGGADIQDVENLLKYFPKLEAFSHIKLPLPYVMMGGSRGAMEMFISLSRSNYIKSRVNNAISVSGNIDLNISMKNRAEMRYLFESQFKNSQSKSFEEWIKSRNPVDNAENLSKSLKVLLIYGAADNRVSLEEQQSFKRALDKEGIVSQLIVVPGANHGLDNNYKDLERIVINFMR